MGEDEIERGGADEPIDRPSHAKHARGGPRPVDPLSKQAMLRRVVKEAAEDRITDWAAALTYYAVLAIFPSLIVMVSLIGLVGDPAATTEAFTDIVGSLGPDATTEALQGPIESVTSSRRRAGIGLGLGLIAAMWSASGFIGAFTRASADIYESPEGRPFWQLRPLQALVALISITVAALVAVSLVLTGPVVAAVGDALGIEEAALRTWDLAKWPVILVLVVLVVALIYFATPNMRLRGFAWVLPGALVAVTVWVLASAGFAFYVSNFGSYDRTYGTLAGVIIFLIWLYVTNLALLLGAELNAERERRAELREGIAEAHLKLQREPRRHPKETEPAAEQAG